MTDHDRIEELLAVRALDGLEPAELGELDALRAEHGDCERCREIELDFDEIAGRLAFALTPVEVAAGGADAVLAMARATEPPKALGDDGADELAVRRERKAGRGWRALVAVAAALLLVAVTGTVVTRTADNVDVQAAWGQQVVTFDGGGGAELAMAYTPGESGVLFWGQNIADPGQDKVYEIWMIDDGTPIKGGCVSPQDGAVVAWVDANVGTTETMAVTVEPSSCPEAPTSDPVLTADLTVV
jgi:hypothetical protein